MITLEFVVSFLRMKYILCSLNLFDHVYDVHKLVYRFDLKIPYMRTATFKDYIDFSVD